MSVKILLVDDEYSFERLVRQRLRHKIKEGQYELLFATDGLEALKILEQDHSIDMVLTDINMPNMDGLTLISELTKKYPFLKSVVVSAYGDMKNIRTAMNLGAFDFITKPINFNDLETTINKTFQEVSLIRKAEAANALALKNEQLVALDQLKSDFFTNISHEFRTPLTVIAGMAQQIKESPDKWFVKGLSMIERNSANLLNLVNQILDLRKVEAGKLSLKLIQGDILPLFHYMLESFQVVAAAKDLQLHFINTRSEIILDYDPERIQQIMSNLIGNAIKFTPAGGDIYLFIEVADQTLKLFVKDTGIGIPTNNLPHIFNRFYQVDLQEANTQKGTGIGLALSKELVQLMEGAIKVESQVAKGTTFSITLPIKQVAPIQNTPTAFDIPSQTEGTSFNEIIQGAAPQNAASILLIEDNLDVAQYITSCLETTYQVSHAVNGAIGIERAMEQIPDIVISDIMMPEKDGFEVVQTLKNDIKTNHIPLILLSAKADIASKLEGLERGADEFLAKPFAKRELLIKIANLLAARERLRLRYTSEVREEVTEEMLSPEDEFVHNIRHIIESNLEDYTFGSSELVKAAMMSRTQLFLKLKALTGYSASQYIRLLRLQKAKKLLKTSHLNISEIAYAVGFGDPKYFSRVFSQEFGVPPTKYRK